MSNNQPEDKSKVQPNEKTKISSADDLSKNSWGGDSELDEAELNQVSGGGSKTIDIQSWSWSN
jgi:bacteriocin-like protein